MASSLWPNTCCNPFEKPNHFIRKKSQLRNVTQWMCDKASSISPGQKICDSCRKQLTKISLPEPCDTEPESQSEIECTGTISLCNEAIEVESSETLELVNQCLDTIGETPLTKRKIQRKGKQYSKKKVERVTEMMRRAVIGDAHHSDSKSDESEIIEQLKDKFSTAGRSEKVQILTVLPKSWSIKRIEDEFGTSNFMARKAKQLVKEKGILATPDPKPGPNLSQTAIDLVGSFYESDDISRMMPGKKDYVLVRKGGSRVHVQKRLVLCNLKEMYQLFKDNHPNEKIGFSKFVSLRPKHCVLAGTSGTHSVCVCTIHQNVKLMMHGVKLPELVSSDATCFETYHHCIANTICNPPQPTCYFGKCNECSGTDHLKESLTLLLDRNMIDNVTNQQWIAVDWSTLETTSTTSEEFVDAFVEKVKLLTPHSFIAQQQARFYSKTKSSLKPGELLIVADFSENYSFVLQDAAQGFHWNNCQATIHPFVVYYKHTGEERHLTFVIVSDCLQHDTVAVYLFQRILTEFLKKSPSLLSKEDDLLFRWCSIPIQKQKEFFESMQPRS